MDFLRFPSLIKILLGVEWAKVLNALGPLCLWQYCIINLQLLSSPLVFMFLLSWLSTFKLAQIFEFRCTHKLKENIKQQNLTDHRKWKIWKLFANDPDYPDGPAYAKRTLRYHILFAHDPNHAGTRKKLLSWIFPLGGGRGGKTIFANHFIHVHGPA